MERNTAAEDAFGFDCKYSGRLPAEIQVDTSGDNMSERSRSVKLSKVLRNGVAGALIASMPVTASLAATRPNQAVPTAGAVAVVAQDDDDYDGKGISWAALAAVGLAVAVALWIILDKDDEGEGSLSRA